MPSISRFLCEMVNQSFAFCETALGLERTQLACSIRRPFRSLSPSARQFWKQRVKLRGKHDQRVSLICRRSQAPLTKDC